MLYSLTQLRIFVIAFCLLFSASLAANTFHVVINGKSFHQEDNAYNETNTGVGFEIEFAEQERTIKFLAASTFKDSFEHTSNYIGGGIKRRYRFDNDEDGWYGDVGIVGFVMTRKDIDNNRPFLGALPFVTLGYSRFAINVSYVPEFSPKTTSLFYVQAKIRLTEW